MSRGVLRWLFVFFAVSTIGLLALTTWSYLDEHSGTSGKATVTECVDLDRNRAVRPRLNTDDVYCTGRWTVDGRERRGDVYNAKLGDVGKTISVRIHDDHASKPQILVTIAAAIFTLFLGAVAVMTLVQWRRAPS